MEDIIYKTVANIHIQATDSGGKKELYPMYRTKKYVGYFYL